MRISTQHIFNIASNSMRSAGEAIVKTQEQISTGKRVLSPADDPVAATKILQLNNNVALIEQYNNNITIAENNLNLEESTLDSITNLLQRARELTVQAGNNATLSPSEYSAIAAEMQARVDELFNLVNTRNVNGDYVFSGYKSNSPAFSGSIETGFSYDGDEGKIDIKIDNNTKVAASDSGKTIFEAIPSDNNVFTTSANADNRARPEANISLGKIVDQEAYDRFYPEDIVITFNPDNDVAPPAKNFTVTEKSTGKIIDANRLHVSGEEVVYHGTSIRLIGEPASGAPATAATRNFGADGPIAFPVDFSITNGTFSIQVNNQIETFVLDANITNTTDLAATLNSAANGNAARLANLGLNVDTTGFSSSSGENFAITAGSTAVDGVLGLNSLSGTVSSDGVAVTDGDQFFVNSSATQGVLTTLARFTQAMRDFDGSAESVSLLNTSVAATLTNLTNAQNSVTDKVTEIGARLNTIESTRELHADNELVTRTVLRDIQSLDYAQAASEISQQSLVLEAAQATFLRVSQLTLFDRL